MNLDESSDFDSILDSFTAMVRRGESVSVDDFANRYPSHAEQIRRLFPVVKKMEQGSPASEPVIDPDDSLEPAMHSLNQIPSVRSLGEYRIVQEIGRGGMGIVYRAEQESLGRTVALKVLPESAQFDERRNQRFRQEAKASGKLLHANIVPVFGVGRDENLSYLVMQYIDGPSLEQVVAKLRNDPNPGLDDTIRQTDTRDNLAENKNKSGAEPSSPVKPSPSNHDISNMPAGTDDNESGSASFDASISSLSAGGHYFRNVAKIGAQVSDALQYAHSQNVLHRDIKPGNLLLDDSGNVWVTDFGIAKLLDEADLTKTGETVGTLRYLPPEQLNGSSDARSDVYSLGLTIYELLTLQPAFQGSDFGQLVKAITDQDPKKPRQINRNIPRDLETIVLKAIAKRPRDRYQHAGNLRDDFKLFLDGKPIRARQTSELERFAKAIKRRPIISTLTALLLFSLITGAALTTWKWRQATAALQSAKREAQSRQAINEFLTQDLLRFANPSLGGEPNISLRTVVDRAAASVESRFGETPEIHAEIRFQLGRIYYGLRDLPEARKHFQRSFQIHNDLYGDQHSETMKVLFRIGKVERQQGNNEKAIEIFDKVIEFCIANPKAPRKLMDAAIQKSGSLTRLNRFAEAQQVIEEFIAEARKTDEMDLPNGLQRLANVLYAQGKYAESEKVIDEFLDFSKAASASRFPGKVALAEANNILALNYLATGNSQLAMRTLRANYEFAKRGFGEKHHSTLVYGKNLADGLLESDKIEAATELLENLLPISERTRGVADVHTMSIRRLLAKAHFRAGKNESGIEILESSLEAAGKQLGAGHRETIGAAIKLGWEYRKQKKYAKTESLFKQAYLMAEKEFGPDDRLTLVALADLGDLHRKTKQFELSEKEQLQAIAGMRKSLSPQHPDLIISLRALIKLYFEQERWENAEPLCIEIVAANLATKGASAEDTVNAMEFLSDAYLELDKFEEAREVLTSIYQVNVAKDQYSDSAMDCFFRLDFVDSNLQRHKDRVARIESYCEQAKSSDHVNGNYWKARGLLGHALMKLKKFSQAEQVLLLAFEGLKSQKSDVEPDFFRKYMGRIAGRLSDVYDQTGNTPQRDQWKKTYRSFRR